jgi:hypothetical protein
MTTEDQARRAIDRMTKRYIDHGNMTPSKARERAQETARRVDRKKREK